MFVCEKCGRPFYLKDALRNHVCDVKPVADNKTKKELIADAKYLKIVGADRMTREQLIEAINAT